MKKFIKIIFLFFILPIGWYFLFKLPLFQGLENKTLSLRYGLRGNLKQEAICKKMQKAPLQTSCIVLNESSLNAIGGSPIPMSVYAKCIYALQKYAKPKAVASDIFFGEKHFSNLVDPTKIQWDEALCHQYLSSTTNVILGGWFNCSGKANEIYFNGRHPLPLIKDGFTDFSRIKMPLLPNTKMIGEKVKLGMINPNISTDVEQTVFWIPLYARTQAGIYYTLALQILRQAFFPQCDMDIYGDDTSTETYHGQHAILFLQDETKVEKVIPLGQRQLLEINWFNSWDSSPDAKIDIVSVLKNFSVLENSSNKDISQIQEAKQFFAQFNDNIIFITDISGDAQKIKTPVDNVFVPSIHAHINTLKTLYYEMYIKHLPEWGVFLVCLLLNFLIVSVISYPETFSKYTKIFIGVIVIYFLSIFYLFGVLFTDLHLILPLIPAIGIVFTFWGFGSVNQMLLERKQRIRLKHIFSNYLSPQIVSTMLTQQEDPQLGGVQKNLTTFFSDIQNFSTFSELFDPGSLVRLMNEYLTEVTDIITNAGGTLDKYIGDAVVAMFGAPFDLENHPMKACMAAFAIQERQIYLRERWARDHKNWPAEVFSMRTRIGLNTGDAIVGNMGSSSRFNFTMMGDTVNLGARCESGAKAYGVYTMLSEDTYKNLLITPHPFVFRFVDRIVVKGRKKPVSTYELVGLKNNLKQTTLDGLQLFEHGLHFYLARNWDKATDCFKKSAMMELLQPGRDIGVSTNPSLVFLSRCRYFKENPPEENWDGTFIMKTK